MLDDGILAGLPVLRAHAESIQDSTCVVDRATGRTVDPATGHATVVWERVWQGPCRLRTAQGNGGSGLPTVGGERPRVTGPTLALPVAAPRMKTGWRVTVTTGTRTEVVWVESVRDGTHLVRQRVDVSYTEVMDR